MSVEKVKEYFKIYGIEDRVQEFEVSSATVELASQALGCQPCNIAKSLTFKGENGAIMIVCAGDAKVDNPKFKAEFNTKATMLSANEVFDLIGHAVGGVCPFAIKPNVDVFLDESLKRFEFVYPACGSSNSAIKLSILELEKYSNFKKWVNVCKNWN